MRAQFGTWTKNSVGIRQGLAWCFFALALESVHGIASALEREVRRPFEHVIGARLLIGPVQPEHDALALLDCLRLESELDGALQVVQERLERLIE